MLYYKYKVRFVFTCSTVFIVVFFAILQVANAERLNASAVLIYPDLVDYKINYNTALFGHVSTYRWIFILWCGNCCKVYI